MKDKQCCVCKTESEHLIFSHLKPNTDGFASYDLKSLTYDQEWKFYVTQPPMMHHIKSLFDVHCKKCAQSFKNVHQLKGHMKHHHNLLYCDLCLEHRKVFLKDQKLYTRTQLKHHIEYGEEDERNGRIDGHPECLFCNKRLYNDDELFFHMYHSHERCHLCEAKGHKFEFFQNYPALQIHFEQEHFPCHYLQCLEKHFIVFDNQLSLNHHILTNHARELSRKEKDKLKNVTATAFISQSSQSTSDHLIADSEQNRRLNQFQNADSSIIRFMNLNGQNLYLGDHQRSIRHNIHSHQREEEQKKSSQENAQHTVTYRPQGRRANGAFSNQRYRSGDSSGTESSSPAGLTPEKEEKLRDEEKQKKMIDLSGKIKSHLGGDKYNAFKRMSLQFQQGEIMATEYYERFYDLFGDSEKEYFDELVSSIPSKDEQRARALTFARNNYHTKEAQQIREIRKNNPPLESASQKKKKKQDAVKQAEKLSEEWPSLSSTEMGLPTWGGVDNALAPPRGRRKKKQKKPAEEFPALGGGSGSPLVAPPQPQHWTESINAHVRVKGQRKGRRRR